MIDALRYEWTRVTTLRSTYWLIGLALGLQLLIATLIAAGLADERHLSDDTVFQILATAGASTGGPPLLVAYLLGVIGVLSFGHEYRHGMIRATLTALSSRTHVLAAKLVVVGIMVGVVSAGTVLLAIPIQQAFDLGDTPWSTDVWHMLVGVVVFSMLFAWSGLAFAAILRNQTAAMLLVLFVPTVVEYVVRYVVLIIKALSDQPTSEGGAATILKFLPYDAGGQMYTRTLFGGFGDLFGAEPFGPVGGGIVMGMFVALLLALGSWRFLNSDA